MTAKQQRSAKRSDLPTATKPAASSLQPPTGLAVTAPPDVTNLSRLAEELGRLLARRLLADPGRRRGYGLPELVLGAAVLAIVWITVARSLGWFVR